MCTSSNTCLLRPSSQTASRSVQPFCTVHNIVFNGPPLFPSNLPLRTGDLYPYLLRGSMDPPHSAIETASRSVQPFCTAYGTASLYFTMDRPPPQNYPFAAKGSRSPTRRLRVGDLDPIQYMVPWAHPSPQSKRHLNQFSSFAGLTTVTDRTTDDATQSVTTGRIYVVLQCGLIFIKHCVGR